jgi:hypothetical protein
VTLLIIGLVVWALLILAGFAIGWAEGLEVAFGGAFVGVIIGIVYMWPLSSYVQAHYNDHVAICHVTEKDRVGTGSGHSEMRIYTSDCGTLVNRDSYWRGKTTSADTYAQITPGNAYSFRIAGWRNGFLSDFPNILEVETAK